MHIIHMYIIFWRVHNTNITNDHLSDCSAGPWHVSLINWWITKLLTLDFSVSVSSFSNADWAGVFNWCRAFLFAADRGVGTSWIPVALVGGLLCYLWTLGTSEWVRSSCVWFPGRSRLVLSTPGWRVVVSVFCWRRVIIVAPPPMGSVTTHKCAVATPDRHWVQCALDRCMLGT